MHLRFVFIFLWYFFTILFFTVDAILLRNSLLLNKKATKLRKVNEIPEIKVVYQHQGFNLKCPLHTLKRISINFDWYHNNEKLIFDMQNNRTSEKFGKKVTLNRKRIYFSKNWKNYNFDGIWSCRTRRNDHLANLTYSYNVYVIKRQPKNLPNLRCNLKDPIQEVVLVEQHQYNMSCNYSGANILWFYNDSRISATTKDIRFLKKNTIMQIIGLKKHHIGSYWCIASWKNGNRIKQCQYHYYIDKVVPFSSHIDDSVNIYPLKPPEIEKGKNFTFTCQFHALANSLVVFLYRQKLFSHPNDTAVNVAYKYLKKMDENEGFMENYRGKLPHLKRFAKEAEFFLESLNTSDSGYYYCGVLGRNSSKAKLIIFEKSTMKSIEESTSYWKILIGVFVAVFILVTLLVIKITCMCRRKPKTVVIIEPKPCGIYDESYQFTPDDFVNHTPSRSNTHPTQNNSLEDMTISTGLISPEQKHCICEECDESTCTCSCTDESDTLIDEGISVVDIRDIHTEFKLETVRRLLPDTKKCFRTDNGNWYYIRKNTKWEIPDNRELKIIDKLGEGNFGAVYRGHVTELNNYTGDVAVKILKGDASQADVLEFIKELNIMQTIGHHRNIIKFLGCVTRGRLQIVMELAKYGDLRTFLREHDVDKGNITSSKVSQISKSTTDYLVPKNEQANNERGTLLQPKLVDLEPEFFLDELQMLKFCKQITCGISFLAARRCVHRDLATRNILVSDGYICKIADFGMARNVEALDAEYYKRRAGNTVVPLKWHAPESIHENKYSFRSDVWALGVVMWEIFSKGKVPYKDGPHEPNSLLIWLREGYRLQQPDYASKEIYSLMNWCWELDPRNRPRFSNLIGGLNKLIKKIEDNRKYQKYFEQFHEETPNGPSTPRSHTSTDSQYSSLSGTPGIISNRKITRDNSLSNSSSFNSNRLRVTIPAEKTSVLSTEGEKIQCNQLSRHSSEKYSVPFLPMIEENYINNKMEKRSASYSVEYDDNKHLCHNIEGSKEEAVFLFPSEQKSVLNKSNNVSRNNPFLRRFNSSEDPKSCQNFQLTEKLDPRQIKTVPVFRHPYHNNAAYPLEGEYVVKLPLDYNTIHYKSLPHPTTNRNRIVINPPQTRCSSEERQSLKTFITPNFNYDEGKLPETMSSSYGKPTVLTYPNELPYSCEGNFRNNNRNPCLYETQTLMRIPSGGRNQPNNIYNRYYQNLQMPLSSQKYYNVSLCTNV